MITSLIMVGIVYRVVEAQCYIPEVNITLYANNNLRKNTSKE